MQLTMVEEAGVKVMEGNPGEPFLMSAEDATRLVEACFSNRVMAALLYAPNLPNGFFDLGSGEAGAVLEKLRNYGVRLAIVCPPGSVQVSSHFGDLLAEEPQGRHFALFETRQAAREWLSRF